MSCLPARLNVCLCQLAYYKRTGSQPPNIGHSTLMPMNGRFWEIRIEPQRPKLGGAKQTQCWTVTNVYDSP